MKWFVTAGERLVAETDPIEIVTEVRQKVEPRQGDKVELRCEGTINRVLGEEVEIANLAVKEVLSVRREAI